MKNNPSKKGQLLKELRSLGDIVSGGQLSATLGISRVSVWKHIHKLQELGYHILSTPNGYRLIDSPDTPFPWEFTDHGFNFSCMPFGRLFLNRSQPYGVLSRYQRFNALHKYGFTIFCFPISPRGYP